MNRQEIDIWFLRNPELTQQQIRMGQNQNRQEGKPQQQNQKRQFGKGMTPKRRLMRRNLKSRRVGFPVGCPGIRIEDKQNDQYYSFLAGQINIIFPIFGGEKI